MSEVKNTGVGSGASKTEWGSTKPFLRKMTGLCRRFYRRVDHASAEDSPILYENSVRLCMEVRAAIKMFRSYRRLPLTEKRIPVLYEIALTYIEAHTDELSQKTLCEFLDAHTQGHSFYDRELTLLQSALVLASISLAQEKKSDHILDVILRLADIDFEAVFFYFSKVEQIFLTEAAGVYRNADVRTRRLYHERLRLFARQHKTDEIACARELVASANKKGAHLGLVLKARRGSAPRLYFYFLTVLTVLMSALFIIVSGIGAWGLLLLPFIVVTQYACAKEFLPPFFSGIGEKILPKLSSGPELEKAETLVAVATLLFGEEKDAAIFDKIEDFYLTNKGENIRFAVLGDLPQATRRKATGDDAVIAYAKTRIEALNAKYGNYFALFIRERRRSVSENAYIGWERKRGGVLELCRFLRGADTSISVFIGDREFLSKTRYLITLDADTNLYIGAVRELIGAMLHPENKPIFDKERGVISGHAVIQPRMTTSLDSASRSSFARLTGGAGGIDIYAGTSSDVYQQVFDEGIFCGKGILDIDVFLSVCDGFFPNERILSHDLVEGNRMRSALGSDIVLSDSTPKSASSYYTRMHRWLRGDLQVLPYLGRHVKNTAGERIQNPMSRLSKFKIFDNFMRGLTPVCAVAAIFLSLIFGLRTAAICALFSFFYILTPVVMQFFTGLYYRNLGTAARRFYSVTLPHFLDTVSYAFFRASAMVHEAYLFVDAAVRTVYRFRVSHKNFLNWTTASEGDNRSGGNTIDGYVSTMWPSLLLGMALMLVPAAFSRVIGFLWFFFPFLMWILSREKKRGVVISEEAAENLIEYSRSAWLYFKDFVNEESNWLPPDNHQLSPVTRTAMRTSPTNIGLYLLSALAARDFDFISSGELLAYVSGTARTLSKMLKWNGHFYNWYDIRTLEVIGEPFVSTVDSGNLITSLVALCEGLKEYVDECPALLDSVYAYEKMIAAADFRALYDPRRRLFKIGYNVKTSQYSDSCYDTFMSESRMTSYFATAMLAVPREHYFSMSRKVVSVGGEIGIASWSGTAFEYFMPTLLLPTAKNSLSDEALAFAYQIQRRASVSAPAMGRRRTVFGISESGYFGFDYEMNYQYRAFGIGRLALDPKAGNSAVISPYSSFLMLERGPARICANLSELQSLGMLGKYGFYEAVDFDSSRVGGGYAIIKSYMAHHVGMSIVASANAVKDGIFRRRFMRSPVMRASAELLSEKIPVSARGISTKKRMKIPEIPPRYTGMEEKNVPKYEYGILYPEIALLSNNKTKVIASSSGHVELADGSDLICTSDFDRYSLGGGLRVYAVIDGETFSAVPLSVEPEGFHAEFSYKIRSDSVEYSSQHTAGKRKYDFSVRFSVYPDREVYEISCRIGGNFRRAHAFLYFQPIADKRNHFEAHKSFSNLFIESDYDSDEEVLLFCRRPRNDKKAAKLIGVAAVPAAGGDFFDTMRDRILPLAASEKDYAALASGTRRNSKGAVIVPACAVKSGPISPRRGCASFYIGYSTEEDELLYVLSKCRMTETAGEMRYAMGDILNLQYSSAGLRRTASALERFVLRGMYFGMSRADTADASIDFIDKNSFWRYSISGENNIVLAILNSDNEEQRGRLFDLIRLFKYMCIRGVRYDFVILYTENDHYHTPCRHTIESMIRRAGCENFVSWTGGIYLIAADTLTAAERGAYETMACAVFELSIPLEITAGTNKFYVPVSEETVAVLKREPDVKIRQTEAPALTPICRVPGGFFHANGFVVEKPHGSVPWAHVLASENFGTTLTENSLGFTYTGNAGMQKLTPHGADNMTEDNGERLYLRIYDRFEKEHYVDYDLCACACYVNYAFGFAEYIGQIEGIFYTVEVYPVGKFSIKNISVRLETGGAESVLLSVIYEITPCLGERRDRTALYRFRKEEHMVHVSRLTDGGMGRKKIAVMAPEATAVYTDSAALRCDGRLFSGREDCAALCVRKEFEGTYQTFFYLASYRSEQELRYIKNLCFSGENVAKPYKTELFGKLSVRTEHILFDEIVNKWSLYQTLVSRIYARCGFYQVGGAYGFRDQLQDALALIPVMPETAAVLILRASAHQYENGSVQHWWHPGTGAGIMTRCSDDFLWLPFVAAEYVRMTGDKALLDKKTPYLSSPPLGRDEQERYEMAPITSLRESVFEHMLRAVENGMRTGTHGLPLFGSCDWNDGMNLVGHAGRGESVWLAFFTVLVLKRMIPLCRERGMEEKCRQYEEKIRELLGAVRHSAFDGEWYLRGFYDDGSVLGGHERRDCQIDILPQAFAMMTAEELGFDRERALRSMDAVYDLLFDKEHQMVYLLTPPFSDDEQSPGYIKGYVPGIRENGGQYTHAAVWASLGFFAGAQNDRGAEILFAINPAMRCEKEKTAEEYQIEPYVLAGDVYSNESHKGRGGWSWYTGSAAWYRKAAIETLCGYTEIGGAFCLNPHFSDRFPEFEMIVSKKETLYRIRALRSDRDEVIIDGESVLCESIRDHAFPFDGGQHEVMLRCCQ